MNLLDALHKKLPKIQEKIGYVFKNQKLLILALTHRSFVNENKNLLDEHNERIEFLGDSVLDLIVSDFMVKTYLDFPEGILSKIRAAVVNEQCLADLARQVKLGDYLLLGKGEDQTGGREKNSILANAYEAVAGAIYVDSDLQTAYDVLILKLEEEIEKYADTTQFRDFKSELQQITQLRFNCIPNYKIIDESGPDHAKEFRVVVMTQNDVKGTGQGRSKKEAEQAAALDALNLLNGKDPNRGA